MTRIAVLLAMIGSLASAQHARAQEAMERPLGGPQPPGSAQGRTLEVPPDQAMTCTVVLPRPDSPVTCPTEPGEEGSLCQCEGTAVLGTKGP
jgi:hypothetical protein